jgi:phosphonate transport system substrate-binding protein
VTDPVSSSRRRLLLATLLGLLLGGCQEAAAPRSAETAAGTAPAGEPLLFAVHPYDTPSRLVDRFQPLCDYLSLRLDRPVALYIAHSYGDQVRRISHGQVDLAYMGPTPYLRARDHYLSPQTGRDLSLLAGETFGGEPGYRGVIVTLASGPIRTLGDLRGQTLALGAHRSFSGHFVPRALLWQAGMTLADLKDYAWLGRHERVALAVAHGDFAAGGLREDVARQYLDRGLRILVRSPLLPPHVVVGGPDLDPAIGAAVRDALITPDARAEAALAALGPGVGFAAVEPAAFESVRRLVRAIEGARPLEDLPW